MNIWGRTEFYDELILFLRRIYEKGSFVAWFDHRRCMNNDAKTAIVWLRDAKSAMITLVRLRDHLIEAARTHDLQEAILANQGAPADHSEILARRTNWNQSVRLNSVGRAHQPLVCGWTRHTHLACLFTRYLTFPSLHLVRIGAIPELILCVANTLILGCC
jgi:hypothetical protein